MYYLLNSGLFTLIWIIFIVWIIKSILKIIKNQEKIINIINEKESLNELRNSVNSFVSKKQDLKNAEYEYTKDNLLVKKEEPEYFIVGDEAISTHEKYKSFKIPSKKDYILEETRIIKEKEKEKAGKREYNFGSKIIPAIGILSILIGTAFFMKYAFDENLISEPMRIILGFVSGMIFIGIGERLRKKFSSYSIMLVGGGFALLYLTAKFGLIYELYSDMTAFAIMAVITFVAILTSYKLNSRLLAYIALIGGFITPFLSWESSPHEFILFNYILILLSGVIFLIWKRNWMELMWSSAILTTILFLTSYSEFYTGNQFLLYWIYLIIFFAIFAITPMLFYLSKKTKNEILNQGNIFLSIISGIFFVAISYDLFESVIASTILAYPFIPTSIIPDKGNGLYGFVNNFYFLIGLIPAIIYGFLAKKTLDKLNTETENIKKENISEIEKEERLFVYKKPVYILLAMASFAVALMPALQFEGIWITISWLLEASVLIFLYQKIKANSLSIYSAIMLFLGIGRMIFFDTATAIINPIFNERALVFLIAILSSFYIAYVLFKKEKKVPAAFIGTLGNLLALLWIWLELFGMASANFFSYDMATILVSFFYLVYASILIFVGTHKKYPGFRIAAIFLFAFVISKTYLHDVFSLDPLYRIGAFIILGIITLFMGYYYNKNKDKILHFLEDTKRDLID